MTRLVGWSTLSVLVYCTLRHDGRGLHSTVIHNTPVNAASTFPSINPATGEVIGEVADCSLTETHQAIKSAKECFATFGTSLAGYRSRLLTDWGDAMTANRDELANLVSREMGKPLPEALGEVADASSFLYHVASQIRTGLTGEVLTRGQSHWRPVNIRQPVGPVFTITPWNIPIAMVTRKAGAAIAAGCSVINAPSEDTPLTSLYLANLATQACFPDVIPCSRANKPALGLALCESPDMAALSFTGSTEVGKVLIRQCAGTVKRAHLELGGNAPFIVFKSADLNRAVSAAMVAKFLNAGQACTAANRIFVHESIYPEFAEKLANKISKLRMGNGLEKKVDIGPLVNKRAFSRVSECVGEIAGTPGVDIISTHPDMDSAFSTPTLVSCGTNTDIPIFSREIFGPVAALYSFTSEKEVVELANSTRYGLQAYIFTSELAQAWRVGEKLEYGMVAVNEGAISSANNPFGGWKESGIGREAGHMGVDEFTEDKLICFGL